ncbi:MAG TPA: DUF2723 domain-containing protein [bacterium]|nr:DUF2723 domain-containing protein [bacterium]
MSDTFASYSPSLEELHRDRERSTNAAWLLATMVFIVGLLLYVATMCRTVFWWDTGELAANAHVLGIPHRPGFPLYVLIGRVFSLSPFGDIFYRVNFLSALSAAIGLGFLAYVWHSLFVHWWRKAAWWEIVLPIAVALTTIAGTYTLWMQAARAEVYAPTLLAVCLMLALAAGADRAARRGDPQLSRWVLAAGLVAGLGLGLHNATFASTLPAFAIFFALLMRRAQTGLWLWAGALLMFLIGLSVYLYLPIRAVANPPLNWGWAASAPSPGWGGVVGIDALDDVIATRAGTFFSHALKSFALLLDELQWGIAVLTAAGIVGLWRKSRRWTILALLIIVGNVTVTALLVSDFNETNPDIHGYLLAALAMVGFLVAAGIASLIVAFSYLHLPMPTRGLRVAVATAALGSLALLGAAPLVINAPYCNLVDHRLAYDYGTEATADLQPNATVFVSDANIDFVLRGLQYCDQWRPDVRVINRDLLPAAWYRDWVFRQFPDLAAIAIPADTTRLYVDRWAIQLAQAGAPVYWEFTETSMRLIYHLIPAGHFFRVSPDSVPQVDARMIRQQEDFERQSRFFNATEAIRRDFDAQRVYVAGLYRAGIFYDTRGHYDRARELFQRALTIHSDAGERKRRGRSSGQGLSQSPPPDSVATDPAALDRMSKSQ